MSAVRPGGDEVESPAGGADRRTVLRAAGGAGLLGAIAVLTGQGAGRAAASPPTITAPRRPGPGPVGGVCTLTPESIEGPFYLPDELVRQDIREDRRGVVLRLGFQVVDADTCEPLPRAAVDIWHCDALGGYSGVAKQAEGEPAEDSATFLRGIQLSGADGQCGFTTIVPGWYPGRAPHIHTKVHVDGRVRSRHYVGGHVVHTGQVFFTEHLMEVVEQLQPYSRSTTERLHNDADAYFQQSGGAEAVVDTAHIRRGHPHQGYTGTMSLAVDRGAAL